MSSFPLAVLSHGQRSPFVTALGERWERVNPLRGGRPALRASQRTRLVVQPRPQAAEKRATSRQRGILKLSARTASAALLARLLSLPSDQLGAGEGIPAEPLGSETSR